MNTYLVINSIKVLIILFNAQTWQYKTPELNVFLRQEVRTSYHHTLLVLVAKNFKIFIYSHM